MPEVSDVIGTRRKNVKAALSRRQMNKSGEDRGSSPVEELQARRINKIFDLLRDGRAPRLRDLAAELNLSKSHLQHLFKRKAGLPLGRLLVVQRLQRAAHLLSNTDMRIKEIASAVGYEHTSSFARAFERRFAASPRMYRLGCDHRKS